MRSLRNRLLALALLPALLLWLAQPVLADQFPGRVGRVSLVSGPVSIHSDLDGAWEPAEINLPVTSRNALWTDAGGRVEVRVGSTTLWLDEYSQVDIQRLDDDTLDAHLVRGTLAVAVRNLDRRDSYTFSTPDGFVILRNDGRYRIDADERGGTRVAVFRGAARFEFSNRQRAPLNVEPGRELSVGAGGDYDVRLQGIAYLPMDDWIAERDRRGERRVRYVSTYMTGYEDLDEYGQWSDDATYGPVWYPTQVAIDWVPYRHGRWLWVRPWGWTWIDAAPWGFAPFHYGRWAYIGGRWGWCPGAYVARPVWAPALVGFYEGAGIGVSVSLGSPIGWYPLAPWERFQPWYWNNAVYVRNINNLRPLPHPVDPRPFNRLHGSTIVERDLFTRGQPITGRIVPGVNPDILARAPTVGGSVLPPRGPGRPGGYVRPTPSVTVEPPPRRDPQPGIGASFPSPTPSPHAPGRVTAGEPGASDAHRNIAERRLRREAATPREPDFSRPPTVYRRESRGPAERPSGEGRPSRGQPPRLTPAAEPSPSRSPEPAPSRGTSPERSLREALPTR